MKYQDAVYGTIDFPDKYLTILESRPLIRLRNIKQLGFTPSIYTGAVHSRYEHTIGKTWILIGLFEQFQLKDDQLKSKYILASLLSEIGTYPFSLSTNWLFSKKLGLSKQFFKEKLYDSYIATILNLGEDEKQLILSLKMSWLKRRIPSLNIFPDLNLIKLASDIDYSLRDAHYSGRYSNSFDLRHFRTLIEVDLDHCKESLIESIRELYRSIYALNSVYGDKTRRFITLIFARLVEFLIDKEYLDIKTMIKIKNFIDLDDDKFIAIMRSAADKAINDNFFWVKCMLEYIEQLNSLEIQILELDKGTENLNLLQLEKYIARSENVDSIQVVAINDNKKNILGYDIFGKRFDCYKDAIESQFFKNMTGLALGSNRTDLMHKNMVSYLILK